MLVSWQDGDLWAEDAHRVDTLSDELRRGIKRQLHRVLPTGVVRDTVATSTEMDTLLLHAIASFTNRRRQPSRAQWGCGLSSSKNSRNLPKTGTTASQTSRSGQA